jgi:hypothetical protein
MNNAKSTTSLIEVLLVLAVAVALCVGIGKGLAQADTIPMSDRLIAACADFPASTTVTVVDRDGGVLGQGASTPPVPELDSPDTCWSSYTVSAHSADAYRVRLGPLSSRVLSGPPSSVTVRLTRF